MLIRTLQDADLQPGNDIRYQPLQLIGPEELSTLGFGGSWWSRAAAPPDTTTLNPSA